MAKTEDSSEWHDMVMHCFNEAADGLDGWEFGGADSQEEYDLARRAAVEVAKRIRAMADRYYKKHCSENL